MNQRFRNVRYTVVTVCQAYQLQHRPMRLYATMSPHCPKGQTANAGHRAFRSLHGHGIKRCVINGKAYVPRTSAIKG